MHLVHAWACTLHASPSPLSGGFPQEGNEVHAEVESQLGGSEIPAGAAAAVLALIRVMV